MTVFTGLPLPGDVVSLLCVFDLCTQCFSDCIHRITVTWRCCQSSACLTFVLSITLTVFTGLLLPGDVVSLLCVFDLCTQYYSDCIHRITVTWRCCQSSVCV